MNNLDITAITTCLEKLNKGVALKTFNRELAIARLESVSKYPVSAMAQYGFLLQKMKQEDFDKLLVALSHGYPTRSAFDHDKETDKGDKKDSGDTVPASAYAYFVNRKESIYKKAMPELPEDTIFIAEILKGKYDSILTEVQLKIKESLPAEIEARKKAEKMAKTLESKGYTVKRLSTDTITVIIPATMADHLAQYGNGEYSPMDNGFVVSISV